MITEAGINKLPDADKAKNKYVLIRKKPQNEKKRVSRLSGVT